MKTREELIRQHEHLLQVYEKVKDMLSGYPNVVNIGIGIKEKDGHLTEEGCITIVVKEKKNEEDLAPHEIIPKEIEGVKTDIIIESDTINLATCSEDTNNYRPIKGGIMINNYRNGSGVGYSGTLGCVAQLNSDNSWVILSNHHVLYGGSGRDQDEIGQPWVGCSWCCKTNVIAKNFAKDESLDCAVAKVNDDISISNVIEEIGHIGGSGAVAAIVGERVRKRGARTGLTSGTISYIDLVTKEITVTSRPAGGPANDPGGCTNYVSGTTIFAYHGDSGSVIVNDHNEIVALLYQANNTYTSVYGHDIIRIQAAMNIKINPTSSSPGVTISYIPSAEVFEDISVQSSNRELVHYLEEKLEETHTGRMIKDKFRQHEKELNILINKHRPVTTTWHRKQGPAYIAAFSRSLKYEEYRIPAEINRVSFQNLLMSMATILEEHGSGPLQQDIHTYAADIIQLSKQCNTIRDFIDLIEAMEKKGTVTGYSNTVTSWQQEQ